jgi:hypothetical protein
MPDVLVEITGTGHDLYYPGERVSLPPASAKVWLAAGHARYAPCPTVGCGKPLALHGVWITCADCGYKEQMR